MTLPCVDARPPDPALAPTPRPRLSVIVPVFNGSQVLRHCLAALIGSHFPREAWELIVVDDGSTDDSADVGAEYADIVIRLPWKARGPAYARNRGCEISRSELLMFADADVCLHPNVLADVSMLFDAQPDLDAAFGSYDAEPTERDTVSQFRNLLHHFVHQTNPGEAETFWSGCGIIRKSALVDAQMFDEWHYSRSEIEDIELGRRLRAQGHQIELRPEIQCTHLRRWSLKSMLKADFGSRGVPWMRILLQERILAELHTLNVSLKERVCVLLAFLAPLLGLTATLAGSSVLGWIALALFALIFGLNAPFYAFLLRHRGLRFLMLSLPLHLLYYITAGTAAIVGAVAHVLLGEPSAPPEVQAEAACGFEAWPPCPRRPANHLWRRYV